MKVFIKEITDLKWRFLGIVIALIFTFLFIENTRDFLFSLFPKNVFSFKNTILGRFINFDLILKQLELMKSNREYYIYFQWYGKNFYQILLLSIILYGFSGFSREIERKTIYFLLSGVDRDTAFLGKVFGGLFFLFLTVLIGGMLPLFWGFNTKIGLEITVSALFTSLFLYMIVVFFSIQKGEDVKTILWSFFTFLLLGIGGSLRWFSSCNIYRYMKGIDIFITHKFPFLPLLLIFIMTLGLSFLNWKMFKMREF